jgi:primosomal protein N' (replication factor Y)
MTQQRPGQPELFGPPASGEPALQHVALVALTAPIDRPYSYAVPDALLDRLQPGMRVTVPFGRGDRPTIGFCIERAEQRWTGKLKPILKLLDDRPLLSPALLELGRWLSRYYVCPLGRTLLAMVPTGVREGAGRHQRRVARFVAEPEDGQRLTAAQSGVIELLRDRGPMLVREVRSTVGCSDSPIRTLADRGVITIDTTIDWPIPLPSAFTPREPRFELTDDQQAALARFAEVREQGGFRALLLFGVTGSGKSEVYVRAMRQVLDAGRQAILLVPEIALTTQTVDRFADRFGRVAVLHSHLTDAERARAWSSIAAGDYPVVIGTRSAVFAPTPRLGLIVVDEEQEPSYKNQQSPRFHTRDAAIKRAQLEDVPILLGSATPSLESWHNAHTLGHFELLRLPKRVLNLPLPAATLVDLRGEHRQRKGIHLLSLELEAALAEVLAENKQALLLLNRRGYANYLFCPSCQTPIHCPQCKTNMVFHRTTGQVRCHRCAARMPVPIYCGQCPGQHKLVRFGMGTQRVEEELRHKFPAARVVRVDSDTMKRADQYRRILRDFEAGRYDVIVGTQMVAKGLDFPFVWLVGIVLADSALAIPDFRASERTFQLVTQVAGRAGRRDVPGRVIVQSLDASVPPIRWAVAQDYEHFANVELVLRRRVGFPPFGRLCRLILADPRDTRARQEAGVLADEVRRVVAELKVPVQVFGPDRCPLSRERNRYRYQILLQAKSAADQLTLMDRLRGEKKLTARTRTLIVDADPVDLL